MLVTGRCLDLDPTVSSKPRWFGTRSANSMNAPDSIFCTRLGGTGGIDEPGVSTGGIDEPGVSIEVTELVVGQGALLRFCGSMLT